MRRWTRSSPTTVRAAQKEAEKQGTLVTSTIDFPQDVAHHVRGRL